MKKLNGTVTLSILDEDNSQRVIFRIIPLCTKDGLIFRNRKSVYPDCGSLRIIPDKREQSSFKERMRAMGTLCCVQLFTDGKELTKVRQNRNYDPNQGECNQYAIYSDVICGFDPDAVFEVFAEGQDHSQALTETVLLRRGMALYGPVAKGGAAQPDTLKPFGNDSYLLQTVEDTDGNERTYYWNPDSVVTWRQRKKAMRRSDGIAAGPEPKPAEPTAVKPPQEPIRAVEEIEQPSQDQIPIGEKLDILNDRLTNEEQITELNLPVSNDANRLERVEKPPITEETGETQHFHGTPITDAPKCAALDKQKECAMHGVIEKQLKERQSQQTAARCEHRPVANPIENLKNALQDVWQIPALHQELIQVLGENREMTKAILQSPLTDCQTKSACSAAKAELDVIEAERIALLVELDKIKANYQQTKERLYTELAKQKQDAIACMEKQLLAMKQEKEVLEETLAGLGDQVQKGAVDLLASKGSMMIASNGSDLIISPTIGFPIETKDIVETVRSTLSDIGFLCKQDCVTEFLVLLSLYDEFCALGASICEAELYIRNVLRALGLLNVTAWPGVFGTLHIFSLLPENDLRTPTVEVIRNNRASIRAYGHKTIRLADVNHLKEIGGLPVFRIPRLNKERGQDKPKDNGKPVSLQTIHAFSKNAELLYKDGEAWFDKLENKLKDEGVEVSCGVYQAMRMFARVAAPQVVGGFTEAADAATLSWIVPLLISQKFPKERLDDLIGDLPRCMQVMNEEQGL